MDMRDVRLGIAVAAVGVAGAAGAAYLSNAALEWDYRNELDSADVSEFCGPSYQGESSRLVEASLESRDVGHRVSSVAMRDCALDASNPYTEFVVTIDEGDGSYTLTAPLNGIERIYDDVKHAVRIIDYVDRDSLPEELELSVEQFVPADGRVDPNVAKVITGVIALIAGGLAGAGGGAGAAAIQDRMWIRAARREDANAEPNATQLRNAKL